MTKETKEKFERWKKEPVFPMQKHTELINLIAEKIKAISYIEIGIYNTEHNFDRINLPIKIGVDPDPNVNATVKLTSDDFFEQFLPTIHPDAEFDIIFIDGLHHADQVRKDMINAWKLLSANSCLIIHDTNPHSEHITHVPRTTREWTGDVYKTICQIESPDFFTLKDDYGVTVIRKTGELKMNDDVVSWDEFDRFRDKILNLKTWDEAVKIVDSWE